MGGVYGGGLLGPLLVQAWELGYGYKEGEGKYLLQYSHPEKLELDGLKGPQSVGVSSLPPVL